ncbi:BREX-1 system adenine-specific DNA-methyltransferase PglX [Enterococcus faecium]|nr:BREX-1 system adenine-specific DNA-methyltransferase PglX [Enterococcus faecium]EGP5096496.1 BREX-1 system adenine-specific DNA-methyltransferase PglX [Enterococcus faecium]EGP5286454.1 BREX-1 system adenine-specific DNA-methyltransferase PglX [Enterococcus faecium]EKA3136171.1 BREX-1 system adenine-specific DNA-methyltransferase PglX [Enterococcus faecium]HEG4559238.1 BREX-1 system adenine-specific DNA-methyltransferase PglX [Enterococcus faecium]
MDKKAIKNFAVDARRKLIDEVMTKAKRLGIDESKIEDVKKIDSNLQEIEKSGIRIQGKEIAQRNKLIAELKQRASVTSYSEAFQELIEEVAYTWFNRLIAIRFMEVNDYLPDTYRVLSSEISGKIEPDIITDIYDADIFEELSSNEQQQVRTWKTDNSAEAMDKLYQLIFIKICNQLNDYLPELFEEVEDYTELLFTASYIKKDGVIADLLSIPEDDFNVQAGGQVEIIGWLYQYYNSEPHNKVVNIYKGIVKKQDIPAATQLFTTDWVVRYMVDNSLGKYWLDHYPNSELRNKLKYLIPDKDALEQTTPVSNLKPEELKVIDNAMGSGHILVYAFDVLMEIYLTLGYSERDAARAIVEYNLYGLEIDKRAYQLSYFAIMMKGRQYDRLFLKKSLSPNLREFIDSPKVTDEYQDRISELNNDKNSERWNEYKELIFDQFENGKELGSIIKLVDKNNQAITKEYLGKVREYISKFNEFTNMDILYGMKEIQEKYLHILDVAEMLVDKYVAVVTNPPYLNKMDKKLKKYVNDNYSDVKKDLFSVFIKLNSQMLIDNGYASFMAPFVWMFISSYEKLRSFLINERNISSLIQMEYSAFEEATIPICTFTIKNSNEQEGSYIKLSGFTGGMEVQKIKTLEAIHQHGECDYFYSTNQDNFKKIPGMPIAYWVSDSISEVFNKNLVVSQIAEVKKGMFTGGNDRFFRLWFEPRFDKIQFNITNRGQIKSNNYVPINKGGAFRRWYGNNEYVMKFDEKNYEEIEKNKGHRSPDLYFKTCLEWTKVTSKNLSVRYTESGFVNNDASMGIYSDKENLLILLAELNSKVAQYFVSLLNESMNYTASDISRIPIISSPGHPIKELVIEAIEAEKKDWDLNETSWAFQKDPLLKNVSLISDSMTLVEDELTARFNKMKIIEESINEFFINEFNLHEILTKYVPDKDITLATFDKMDRLKKFISYSAGIIFGRYSLDEDGLIFAGGEWEPSRYQKFKPDADNVLLITDDEYFKDSQIDIVNRFIDFVEVTFGEDTLEENLQFIADTLGGKGEPKEIIRRYFLKDFYKDHLKTYSNRPIYWQLDSGKQNGFKALMYLHRYTPDQLGKVRTEYLHELQKAYDNRIELRQQQISTSDNQKEKNTMTKEIAKIQKQLKEVREYDEKLGHLALKRIELDLDDGVIVNYDKLQRDPKTGEKFQILAKGVKEPKK